VTIVSVKFVKLNPITVVLPGLTDVLTVVGVVPIALYNVFLNAVAIFLS